MKFGFVIPICQCQRIPGAFGRNRASRLGRRVWLGNGLRHRSLGRARRHGSVDRADQAWHAADSSVATTSMEARQRARHAGHDLGRHERCSAPGSGALDTGLRAGRRRNRPQETRRADGRMLSSCWSSSGPANHSSSMARTTTSNWNAPMGDVVPVQQPRIPIWNVGADGQQRIDAPGSPLGRRAAECARR